MSTTDENALHEELVDDFGLLEPGPAPVDATVRRGRAIRARRRAALSGGLAAVAVLGVAFTSGVRPWEGGSARASSGGRISSVDLSRPDGKGGWIASGKVAGKPWRATTDADDCVREWEICVRPPAAAPNPAYLIAAGDPAVTSPAGRAAYARSDVDRYAMVMRDDVGRVEVELADGEMLVLRPMAGARSRFALFELPKGFVGITRVTAYSADAGVDLGFTIPFAVPAEYSIVATWYQPREVPDPTDDSVPIGNARLNGEAYGVQAWVGPYGVCIRALGGTITPVAACEPPTAPWGFDKRLSGLHDAIGNPPAAEPAWLVDAHVGADIDSITVRFKDGTSESAHVSGFDGHRFATMLAPPGAVVAGVEYSGPKPPAGSSNP